MYGEFDFSRLYSRKIRHAQQLKCEIESCLSNTECCQFFQIFKVGIKWAIIVYLSIVY